MEYLVANLAGRVRRERYQGRLYIVAPITLIQPGVLNGSQGPILYELPDIRLSVDAWNGVPLLLGHPTFGRLGSDADVLESTGLGFVSNAKVTKRLIAEGWFDVELVRKRNRELLQQIEAGKAVEVSTGLKVAVEHQSGVDDRGRAYNRIARNYRPDHLAVLVGQTGACSIDDGCGINNERIEEMCTTCNQGAVANQSDLLGLPSYEFANPLAGMESVGVANSVGRDDDLLGLPTMNFANPPVKAKPAVANRSQVRNEDEPVGELPWHFANPLR